MYTFHGPTAPVAPIAPRPTEPPLRAGRLCPTVEFMKRLASLSLLVLAACGGEILASTPVALDVGGIKEGDVRNDSYNRDKSITSES